MTKEFLTKTIVKLARQGDPDARDIVHAIKFFVNDTGMDLEKFREECEAGGFEYDYSHYEEHLLNFISISSDDSACKDLEKEYQLKHSVYSTALASHFESNTQFQKYHNERTGHGYAAEDANALNDLLRGRSVEKTGQSNKKDGEDRIVDGMIRIQTKYYKTAEESVKAAFDKKMVNIDIGGKNLKCQQINIMVPLKRCVNKFKAGRSWMKVGIL